MPTKNETGIIIPLLRGDVYLVNLEPIIGKEIGKARPAVIIQNDVGNKFSPVTIIAPISSIKEITKPLPIMIFLEKGEGGLKEESFKIFRYNDVADKLRPRTTMPHKTQLLMI